MFALFPSDEQRALRLHREAITIDTLGGYPVWTKAMLKCIDEMIAKNADVFAIMNELQRISSWDVGELEPEWEQDRRKGGLTAMSITSGPWGKVLFSHENAVRDLADWMRRFDTVPNLVKVTSSKDIDRAKREGKFGVILNFQNTTHIGWDLDNIGLFYNYGIRVVQLTYNDQNLVGAGCTERIDGGLSRYGLKVVQRLNERGILVDVSHCGYKTTLDAAEASDAPIAITHTICKAVNNHDRGKTDDQLEAVAKRGGYVGICVVPFFITSAPQATLEHWLDHVDHAVKVVGADKVGIGTDWGGREPPALGKKMDEEAYPKIGFRPEHKVSSLATTTGYLDWTEWPNFARALVSRGYKDEEIKGILGGNFLRLFKTVVG